VQGNNDGDDESEDIMKTTLELAREAKVTPDIVATHGQFFTRIEHLVALARADEREACAKVCETTAPSQINGYECAAAIRARGNT
jgi:hypothetical protein